MKKRIFFVADVDECRVKAGHKLLDLSEVNVADGVGLISALFLERHQAAILGESYRDLLRLDIDDKSAFHSFILD